jgi:hypothetical protein
MTERATIRRPTETAGGLARLTTTTPTVATNVPFLVTRSQLRPTEEYSETYGVQIGEYTGHCPVETDIRRGDWVTVGAYVYLVHGPLDNPTIKAERRISMDIAAYDGDGLP